MSWIGPVTVLMAFGLAVLATGFVRRYALETHLLDQPTARSSHSVPTPRAGGLAIVCACVVVWFLLWSVGLIETHLLLALCTGGLLVAAIGFLDDRRGVDPRIRLTIHLLAAATAVAILESPLTGRVGTSTPGHPWAWVIALVGVGWFVNLFNFMDGIDGLASGEAAFASLGGAFLQMQMLTQGRFENAFAALALGGAALGFLYWNCPVAKVFMGDVGSGFLGFVIGVLAYSSTQQYTSMLFPWLTLTAVFWVDATTTLLRRALRGERVYQAHRTHAYQWLARRWHSHGRVTLLVMAINTLYLLPLAWWECVKPKTASRAFLAAVVPLVVAAVCAGSGRSERQASPCE